MSATDQELDGMIRAVLPGGRRHGKMLALAELTAALLKAGHTVTQARPGPDGKMIVEKIVGVPGFDDGRQLERKP